LAGLQPAGGSINRDELMYRTGYAAARRHGRTWQGMAALLAVALAGSLAMQGLGRQGNPGVQVAKGPAVVQSVLLATGPGDPERGPAVGEPNYLILRNEVLEKGMAALPQSDLGGQTALPRQLTLQEVLGEPPRPVEPIVPHRLPIVDYILLGGRS
jgi:hypothetical protein